MIKKSLLLTLVSSLLVGTSFLIYILVETVNHQRQTQESLETIANFSLFDFDSVRFYISSNRKTVLVYFDSECDHCRYELDEIIRNKNYFKDSDIVLMSSELISTIKFYAIKNWPVELVNIHFTKINRDEAYETFGSLVVPQIFIYGADGNLVKKFTGATKIDALLEYL